jgi:uncharacterized protein YjbI with pentapeptide repeats
MIIRLAAGLLLSIALALPSLAASKKDMAQARAQGSIGSCVRCDLSGADFTDGFFQLANLIEANLANAKLDGANLAGAQLNNANLQKATFHFTNLSGARLEGADLRGADMTRAWLNWAWLDGARLDGANFTGAVMIGAQLQGADLSNVIGLTPDQLKRACGDWRTKVPAGIAKPECPF